LGGKHHRTHLSHASLFSLPLVSAHQQVPISTLRKRLFGVFDFANTPKGKISVQELIYITVAIMVCLMIALLKLSIRDIIDLNGALVGCLFVYMIPAALHIRCLYYGKGKIPIA
jgi:hypothetical protein